MIRSEMPSIRAEDLGLQGLEGTFIATLVKESIAAHGQLHYDVVHGRKGFVYSFVRNECPYAAKALPVICRVLARSGYKVPKLKEPILEMSIGLQRVFITEYETRVFVANGLEALINVMESLQPPTGTDTPNTPIVLSVRAEAFVDNLLPVMTGRPAFRWTSGSGCPGKPRMSFAFPPASSPDICVPGSSRACLPASRTMPLRRLRPVSICRRICRPKRGESWPWRDPAIRRQPVPRRAALPLSGTFRRKETRLPAWGSSLPTRPRPMQVHRFKNFFTDPKLTAECGGGTVFLAATSELLLTRMKEACERQSLSVLDWEKGSLAEAFSVQTASFLSESGSGNARAFPGRRRQEQRSDGCRKPVEAAI